MANENRDFLIINNVRMPIPAPGMTIDSAIGVDAGRNANNQVVGQVVGCRQWKINNLVWRGLTECTKLGRKLGMNTLTQRFKIHSHI